MLNPAESSSFVLRQLAQFCGRALTQGTVSNLQVVKHFQIRDSSSESWGGAFRLKGIH